MEFLKGRDLFGSGPSKEIPCLTGEGKPTTATVGAVGCLYMDTDKGTLYKCTKVENGSYIWTQEAGLYYTPVVTQPSDTTVQIAFKPSISGAPIPNPVVVELPAGSGDSGQNANGLNATARALLITVLRNGVYSTDQSANITALEKALASGGSGDSGETEKTLTSISATYSGGSVAVGTAVSALTGVVVTVHYSDGSTATVTDYTLSGSIADGSNTITVAYGGLTTTFAVTGVAESGEDDTINLYFGEYLKSTNIESHSENGNVFTYTPTQNGSSIIYTIEGLEADKEYTIFVESTRTDGGDKYTQVSVNTSSAAVYDGKLVSLFPSWAGAGKNYATFTANGETMYLWCAENGANVGGTTPTLTVYIYEGTLTERP